MINKRVQESHVHETARSYNGNGFGLSAALPKFTLKVTQPMDADGDDQDDDGASWHSTDSSCNVLDSCDIVFFSARSEKAFGRLIIYANGVRFVRSSNGKEVWRRTFLELAEMRKLVGSALSRVTLKALEQLELIFTDGSSVVLEAMKDRDEAFNTIIGFSALQWQVSFGIGHG